MRPGQFVLFYGLFVGILVLSIRVFRKGSRRPTQLNLRANRQVETGARKGNTPVNGDNMASSEKSLNVLFNYNGHTWDAYEVLGVPAGSSHETVRNAYEKLRATVAPDMRPFLDAAFDAIADDGQLQV